MFIAFFFVRIKKLETTQMFISNKKELMHGKTHG
jgi:hypothetical protein